MAALNPPLLSPKGERMYRAESNQSELSVDSTHPYEVKCLSTRRLRNKRRKERMLNQGSLENYSFYSVQYFMDGESNKLSYTFIHKIW